MEELEGMEDEEGREGWELPLVGMVGEEGMEEQEGKECLSQQGDKHWDKQSGKEKKHKHYIHKSYCMTYFIDTIIKIKNITLICKSCDIFSGFLIKNFVKK
jgi:hypothetical protein